MGSGLLNTYGVTSFWDQSAVTFWSMSYDQYFWYIFFMRMKGLIVILLLGTVFGRRIVTRVFLALFLFLTGIFITMSVIERGLSGIAAVLLAMLPQWIFYLLAFTVYERGRERKVIFVCALLVVLGCLAEDVLFHLTPPTFFCLYYIVISSLNNFAVRQIQINLYFPLFRSLYHESLIHDHYLHLLRSAVLIISLLCSIIPDIITFTLMNILAPQISDFHFAIDTGDLQLRIKTKKRISSPCLVCLGGF